MCPRGLDDAACELGTVAVLDVDGEAARVQLARQQEVVDDLRQPRRLFVDHLEQLRLQRRLELEILAPQRDC